VYRFYRNEMRDGQDKSHEQVRVNKVSFALAREERGGGS